MKKVLLTLLTVLCAVSAWAEEKSYTLTFKDTGNATQDGSSAWSNKSSVSDVLSGGNDYVASIISSSNVYPARTGRGAKFGATSKAGSITFNLSAAGQVTAKKVEITGGAYISKNKAESSAVIVNNGTAVAFNQTVTSYTEETITYNFSVPTDITSLSITQNTASNGRFFVTSIKVYYDEDPGSLETASWTLNPTTADVYIGKSTELALTTNFDGTLSFTSNDPSIATVNYNSLTNKITVIGVTNGVTSIAVYGAATSKYKAISKTISVNVTPEEKESNKTVNSTGWGYSYFGLTPSGTAKYVQPDESNREKTEGILSMTIKRNGSSFTKPRYDESYLRLYKGNSIEFTVPSGYLITSVTFTEPTSGKSWAGSMTTTSGVYTDNNKKWTATTDVNSVEITGSEDTKRIGGVVVNLYKNGYITTVNISAAGYSTYYNSNQAFTLPTGMTASVWSDGLAEMYNASDVVPAGEPVVLKADAGSYDLIFGVATEESYKQNGMNDLEGTDAATAINPDNDYYFYGLSLNAAGETNSVGFYWMAAEGAAFTNGAHKAYLKLAKSATSKSAFRFNNTTGIKTVNAEATVNKAVKRIMNGQFIIEKAGKMYNAAGAQMK